MSKYKIIDLFSGSGGLSLGFAQAGFENLFSVEFNHQAAKTYRINFPHHTLIEGDIKEVSNSKIRELQNNNIVDIIVGGPPCQGFSIAGNIGRRFVDDERNKLFKEFVRFVHVIQPKMFLMENVARLATHNKGQTIKEILTEFENLGYDVKADGYFDSKTTEAVKQFQKSKGISETGEVNEQTGSALMNAIREELKKNDTQYKAAVKALQ